jgi:TonB family protein
MTSQSPSAYFLSAMVHALAVAALMLTAWVMHQNVREPAKVIELVAGAGDNWSATVAPALGSPTGDENIKMPDIPEPPVPSPEPQPMQAAEPEPVQAAPQPAPKVVPVEKAVTKPSPLDTKKTTLAQDAKRLAEKRQKRLVDKFRKEQAAADAAEKKRMSKEEFDKAMAKGGGSKVKRIDAKGIAGGVVGGSTANAKGGAGGKALSVSEQNLLDQYFAYFKQRLKSLHVAPPGVGDSLTVNVEFFVAADGSVSRVRITQSSGNSEFDQSVLEAFRLMKSIGARPDGRSDLNELEFNMKDE